MTIFSLTKRKAEPGSLSIGELSVTYTTPGGDVEAVRGVSAELRKGKVLAVVGQSGCGKSTLVSAVLGLLPPEAVAFGRVVFEGVDMLN
ncbi:MAG: ATP-binding cassette domain-containing protein, partial [Deltaproteobacteria bacterium]|nr:ATP-binding cassette domain-containing protein [Deltaproteobacteria bacterium]